MKNVFLNPCKKILWFITERFPKLPIVLERKAWEYWLYQDLQLEFDLFLVKVPGGVFSPTFLNIGVAPGTVGSSADLELGAKEVEILDSKFLELITWLVGELFSFESSDLFLTDLWSLSGELCLLVVVDAFSSIFDSSFLLLEADSLGRHNSLKENKIFQYFIMLN